MRALVKSGNTGIRQWTCEEKKPNFASYCPDLFFLERKLPNEAILTVPSNRRSESNASQINVEIRW
jgi:hypothetical protein